MNHIGFTQGCQPSFHARFHNVGSEAMLENLVLSILARLGPFNRPIHSIGPPFSSLIPIFEYPLKELWRSPRYQPFLDLWRDGPVLRIGC